MDFNTISKSKYCKILFGCASIGLGSFLIIEHIYTWGSFDFWDFIGHDWLGLLLILAGIGINLNFDKSELSSEIKNLIKNK